MWIEPRIAIVAATPQASPKSAGSSRQNIRARENAASSSAAHRLSDTAPDGAFAYARAFAHCAKKGGAGD